MADEEGTPQTEEELVNEAFNLARDAIENLLSVTMGLDVGLSEWVIVAVPVVHMTDKEGGDGIHVAIEPRIITERFLPEWKAKGLLIDGTDSFRRDDITGTVVEVLGPDEEE